ncbi:MAG: hypothetical protein ACE5R4_15285 [Armatimonadota bacterium]
MNAARPAGCRGSPAFVGLRLVLAAVAPLCAWDSTAAQIARERADQFAHYALFARAAEAYRQLLREAPDDVELKLALAEVLYRDRRLMEAERECAAILQAPATPAQKARAHVCLGDVYRRLMWRPEAREQYAKARGLTEFGVGEDFGNIEFRVKRGLGLLEWDRAESARTIVCFPPRSPVRPDAPALARYIDTRIASMEEYGGGRFTGKLEVYCFSNMEQWDDILGGGGWSFGSPQEKTVYIKRGWTFFNLMRILEFYIGNEDMKDVPHSTFVTFGFAAAFCGSEAWARRIPLRTAFLKRRGSIPPLTDLLASTTESNTMGALGASFTWYLIRTYGAENYNEFWKAFNESDNPLEDVYGKTVAQMEAEWHSTIR